MSNQNNTLITLFEHNARHHASAAAVIFEGRTHSHADFYEAIKGQAASLAHAGIGQGDRLLVLSANRPEMLVLLGAVAWLGAMLVPLNWRLSPAEMAAQAQDACPAMAIVDADCAALWQAAWPEGMPGVPVAALEASTGGLYRVGQLAHAQVPRQDAPGLGVVMLYTAAVEGHARGAVLAQSQLVASASQTGRAWSLAPHDRWLGVLPLFHAAGIGLALALLGAGGACVLLPRFDPAACVAAIEQHQITVCATFAPMLGALLTAAQASGSQPVAGVLASLRIAMGLEPAAEIERLGVVCPNAAFWSAYGQAEVSSMVCLGLHSERPGAAGRAVAPMQVRIQDAAGRPVAVGVAGEIAVNGPSVFLGYWEREAKRAFKPAEPWHRTGDLGHLDDEGWLWFKGRAAHKQLIKTGGENVYPAEIEQVLLDHPAIAEAFVYGQPDEKWGEAVHAVCALKPGQHVSDLALLAFLEARIAKYKKPKRIHFRPAPLDRHHQPP